MRNSQSDTQTSRNPSLTDKNARREPARTARARALRLARDVFWDAEVRRQAADLGIDPITVDGSRTAADLADEVAARLQLDAAA